jgi:hypothetical protein
MALMRSFKPLPLRADDHLRMGMIAARLAEPGFVLRTRDELALSEQGAMLHPRRTRTARSRVKIMFRYAKPDRGQLGAPRHRARLRERDESRIVRFKRSSGIRTLPGEAWTSPRELLNELTIACIREELTARL